MTLFDSLFKRHSISIHSSERGQFCVYKSDAVAVVTAALDFLLWSVGRMDGRKEQGRRGETEKRKKMIKRERGRGKEEKSDEEEVVDGELMMVNKDEK